MLPEPIRTLDPQDDTHGVQGWEGVIVLSAATSFTAVKAADHHMAERLSRLAPVLYVDPPLSPLTPCRNRSEARALRGPRLRLQSPGLARLAPVVQPGPSRPALASLRTVLARWYLRRATARFRGRVHAIISAGVDRAPSPSDVRLPGPTAGLIGHINARVDLQLLEAIADRGRSLLLVGPKDPAFKPERFEAAIGRPNVCWVGSKPFERLLGYLRLIDVRVVPYQDSAFNRGSFPIKTLEYIACDPAVVATDLPSILRLGTDLVTFACGTGASADAVDPVLDEVRSPAMVAHRRGFVCQHDWAQRAADMHAAIMDRRGRRPDVAQAVYG